MIIIGTPEDNWPLQPWFRVTRKNFPENGQELRRSEYGQDDYVQCMAHGMYRTLPQFEQQSKLIKKRNVP